MKKVFAIIIILCISATIVKAQNINVDAITGEWLTAAKDAKILIFKQGNKFYGKINWGKTTGRKDDKNPDAALRNRDLIGTIILKDFVFDGKEKWTEGTIYDPNNGKTYACIIKLKDNKTLDVRGYVGISLFGRTEIWTR